MFYGLRGAVDHHHIAFLEHGIRLRIASDDTIAADGANGGSGATLGQLDDAAADGPGMGRQNDAVQLLAKGVAVVQMLGAAVAEVLAHHAVAMAANIVHTANHTAN